MARIALSAGSSDDAFHLSGKSFVSLMLGFGCNVPAILADGHSIMNKRPSCLAFRCLWYELPVYVLFASAFSLIKAALMLSIYGIGILLALVLALIASRF